MKEFTFLLIAASLLILHGEASVFRMMVKEGDEVPIDFGSVDAIKRQVPAGEQTFQFKGDKRGTFIDSSGKRINSSNYGIRDGALIIKKFKKSDVGSYASEPKIIFRDDGHGGMSAVLGPTLMIEIKQ